MSDLLPGRSITIVVDVHYSSFKSVNSGAPLISVLSPNIFQFFACDFFSLLLNY